MKRIIKIPVISSINRVFRATRLLWGVTPIETTIMMLLLGIQGAVPAVVIHINKLIIDNLVDVNQNALIALVAAWIGIQFLGVVLIPISQLFQGSIAEKFTAYINLELMSKAEQILGLDILEQQEYYNDLEVLRTGAGSRPLNLIVNLVSSVRDIITFLALSILLVSYAVWLPLVILLSAIPFARATLHLRELGWRALLSRSVDARTMEYYSRIALSYEFAHEVRVFGLFEWLRQRYKEHFTATHHLMQKVRLVGVSKTILPMLLSLTIAGLVFAWAVKSASVGLFSVGVIVLVLQGMNQIRLTVNSFIESVGYLFDRSLFFDHYFRFLSLRSSVVEPENPLPIPKEPIIIFNDVSFSYADGRSAIKNISFSIPYGKTVAIVGENGAGKTTLVKLLLRFYNPTKGDIFLNNHNINKYSITCWRSMVGVVFQNFGRYAFTISENIGIGYLPDLNDDTAIQSAGRKAGLDSFVSKSSQNITYDTKLGKEFDGTELSGGQWQKLAIARALLRQPKILILDEPSAALDPRSEGKLLSDFAELSEGRTTILISHRLSSVKMADTILVLKDGSLIETGTHDDLLKKHGEYYELWNLQASKYRNDVVKEPKKGECE